MLLLLDLLRAHRCLLVLDNLETVLQPGQSEGNCVEGYAPYGVVQLPVRWNISSYHYIPVVRAGC
jgi:hypothetical protein